MISWRNEKFINNCWLRKSPCTDAIGNSNAYPLHMFWYKNSKFVLLLPLSVAM